MTTSTITARRQGDPQHYVEGKINVHTFSTSNVLVHLLSMLLFCICLHTHALGCTHTRLRTPLFVFYSSICHHVFEKNSLVHNHRSPNLGCAQSWLRPTCWRGSRRSLQLEEEPPCKELHKKSMLCPSTISNGIASNWIEWDRYQRWNQLYSHPIKCYLLVGGDMHKRRGEALLGFPSSLNKQDALERRKDAPERISIICE